jgi:spore coat polysaccharide biosynthesis protein SpsF
MKIIATIQARMGSSRLPGKVLKEVQGEPLLHWQIERLKRSELIDDIVVCTTLNKKDDAIEIWCQANGISYFRGSENDVLARVTNALIEYSADVNVECYGDSPLIDPMLVDLFLGVLIHNPEISCVTNTRRTTFPPGSEVLVYHAKELIRANSLEPSSSKDREHVGINVYKYLEHSRVREIVANKKFFYPNLYIEVDTDKDFVVVESIIRDLYPKWGIDFTLSTIIDFLISRPELTESNQNEERRWKEYRIE